ncbi:MAG TPA: class I SAM-dependent methyltransferase [Rhizomicrobium sp.]|jgi:2-polyprenyl-3-methyl-5-hydroxy-6-metoxy-1,4-benzoquinol methylase|nr:class I SAM-dependent methyltransferase [Rhizomicrobium sp.]
MNRKEWNNLAATFEKNVCDISREETHDQVRRYVALAKVPRRGAVLADMGCGIGTFILQYGNRFAQIFGVEYAAKIIARAKKRCTDVSGVEWHTAGVEAAGKHIGPRADFTVCMNVITVPNKARRRAMWDGLASVTKRGGQALVVVASIESEEMIEGLLREGRAIRADGLVDHDGALQKHFAREELRKDFSDAGFAVKKIGKAFYPWAKEGLRETAKRRASRPWDWIALAQRI